jgi:hypothetical protein
MRPFFIDAKVSNPASMGAVNLQGGVPLRDCPLLVESGSVDRYKAWTVYWRLTDFSLKNAYGEILGPFSYARIVLPIEIVVDGTSCDAGHAVMMLDSNSRVKILEGLALGELGRFKRRASSHVLAAVRKTPYGCSDCASEARMSAFLWAASACPGCREYYCRNQQCLKRLRTVVLNNGAKVCRYCGTENDPNALNGSNGTTAAPKRRAP